MAGFWNMIGNSLKVWVFTSLSGTVLAVTFAYYIYRRNLMSNFFKFVLFLPSVLPGILLAVMYKKFVGLGIPAFMNYLCDTTVSDVFNAGAAGKLGILVGLTHSKVPIQFLCYEDSYHL